MLAGAGCSALTCSYLPSHSPAPRPPNAHASLPVCPARRHGRGKFAAAAYRYDGEWRDDKQHGAGACQTEAGDKYVGKIDKIRQGRKSTAPGSSACRIWMGALPPSQVGEAGRHQGVTAHQDLGAASRGGVEGLLSSPPCLTHPSPPNRRVCGGQAARARRVRIRRRQQV